MKKALLMFLVFSVCVFAADEVANKYREKINGNGNSYPANENLEIVKGNVDGVSNYLIRGIDDTVVSTSYVLGEIWDDATTVYTTATAVSVEISSTSAADTSDGTGARPILINGLGDGFIIQTEEIILSGTTTKECALKYTAINELTVQTFGTGNTNAGAIYVRLKGAANELAVPGEPNNKELVLNGIAAGVGISRSNLFTAPATDRSFIITNGFYALSSKIITINTWMKCCTSNKAINLFRIFMEGSETVYTYDFPFEIPVGRTIYATVASQPGETSKVSAFIEMRVEHVD